MGIEAACLTDKHGRPTHRVMGDLAKNLLYFGDNLKVLREHVAGDIRLSSANPAAKSARKCDEVRA